MVGGRRRGAGGGRRRGADHSGGPPGQQSAVGGRGTRRTKGGRDQAFSESDLTLTRRRVSIGAFTKISLLSPSPGRGRRARLTTTITVSTITVVEGKGGQQANRASLLAAERRLQAAYIGQ